MTAAIFALIGVLVAQISLHLIEWIKSRREQQRARRERELNLKRETYLPLMNAFSEAVMLFISVPQLHHSKLADWKLSADAQRALSSVGLIASGPVISAINHTSKQLSRGSMRLMVAKMDEMKLSIELESIESQIKQLNEANGQNLARMRGLQDAGKLDPQLAANIDSDFQRNGAEIQRLLGEQGQGLNKRIEILQALQLQSLKEAVALAEASVDAVIAIREDLGIATDVDELERHFKDSISFVDETFPGLVNDVWRKTLRENSSE